MRIAEYLCVYYIPKPPSCQGEKGKKKNNPGGMSRPHPHPVRSGRVPHSFLCARRADRLLPDANAYKKRKEKIKIKKKKKKREGEGVKKGKVKEYYKREGERRLRTRAHGERVISLRGGSAPAGAANGDSFGAFISTIIMVAPHRRFQGRPEMPLEPSEAQPIKKSPKKAGGV